MLTGLEQMFLDVTGSNSSLLRAPGFIVSPVGNGEGKKNEKGRKEKEIEKKRNKGRKDRRKKE